MERCHVAAIIKRSDVDGTVSCLDWKLMIEEGFTPGNNTIFSLF